jgi:hypothetical protein
VYDTHTHKYSGANSHLPTLSHQWRVANVTILLVFGDPGPNPSQWGVLYHSATGNFGGYFRDV